MTTTRTPGPWQYSDRNWRNEPDPHNWYVTGGHFEDGDGAGCTAVAVVTGNATAGDIPRANAEFIVRACNAHDELLAACKRAAQFIRNGIEFGYITMPDADTPDPAHGALPMIDAAIIKATGETNWSVPRRSQMPLWTLEERAIWGAKQTIEKLGAHPLLTDVVVMLGNAQDRLADWIDGQKE